MKKRLLILTADAGFGHRSASNAVAQAYTILHKEDGEVFIVNPVFDSCAPILIRKSQEDYDRNVVKNPAFYEISYKISDTPPASLVINSAMSVLLKKTMRNVIDQFQPDGVLSTFHFYQAALGPILAAQPRKIPFFSVVTDLADVHQLWFERSPDILFVPTEKVRSQALQCGFPQEKIIFSGMPVNPSIALEKRTKEEIRASLGWDTNLPVVLVVASKRVNRAHLIELLQRVDQDLAGSALAQNSPSHQPLQMVMVAGGDEALYQELNLIQWRLPVHLYNYVENMSALLHASDVLVSKAGGLISSEALACGLPMILIENLPGQEEGNVRFLCLENAAISVSDPDQFATVILSFFENSKAKLAEYAQNASRIGRPDAAFTIANTLWEMTGLDPRSSMKLYSDISRSNSFGRRSQRIP